MRIDDLIKELQKFKNKYGNLEVIDSYGRNGITIEKNVEYYFDDKNNDEKITNIVEKIMIY